LSDLNVVKLAVDHFVFESPIDPVETDDCGGLELIKESLSNTILNLNITPAACSADEKTNDPTLGV